MRKRGMITLILMLLMLFVQIASAAQICVLLDTPLFLMNDAKVQKEIDSKVSSLFSGKGFSYITVRDSLAVMQMYREENGLAGTTTAANNGQLSYQWALKMSEIHDIGKRLNCDHVLLIRSCGNSQAFDGYDKGEITLLTDVRIYSMEENKYTYMKTNVNTKKSKKYTKSVTKAFLECLQKLDINGADI